MKAMARRSRERLRHALEERVAQLKALSRSQALISAHIDKPTVLRGVLDEQVRVLGADTGMLVLREGQSPTFRVAAACGYGGREAGMLQVRVSLAQNAILQHLSRNPEGLLIEDVRCDARVQNLGGSTEVERTLLVCPLVYRGTLLGVSAVSRTSPFAYGVDHLELLSLFSNQASVAIANAQLHQTVQAQRDELARRQHLHTSLLNLVLAGGDLQAIAEAVAECTETTVEILGRDGRLYARAEGGQTTFTARSEPLRVPVILRRQPVATLCLAGPAGLPPKRLRALAEQAALVVALAMMREQATQEAERRLRSELLEDLLMGRLSRTADVAELAHRLGWQVGCAGQICLAVVEARPGWQLTTPLRLLRQGVVHVLEGWARERLPGTLTLWRDDTLILLVPTTPGAPARAIQPRLLELVEHLATTVPEALITVGIGDVAQLPASLQPSFDSARCAVDLACALGRRGGAWLVADFGVLALLARAADRRQLETYATDTLHPLLCHSDLLATLRLYLSTSGSLSATAARLHLHRNTVLYRLKRIEELLSVTLSAPDTRFNLDLALKVLAVCRPDLVPDLPTDSPQGASGP